MMRFFYFSFLVFVGMIFTLGFTTENEVVKIHWKKIDTELDAGLAMREMVPSGATFESANNILSRQKSDYYGPSGDTLIHFHSPYVPVRPMSLVARKWMYQLHFDGGVLVKVDVEEGLLGP